MNQATLAPVDGPPWDARPVVWEVKHPETGVPLLQLSLYQEGPVRTLHDFDGKPRVELCACPFMGAAVSILGPTGRTLAMLMDNGPTSTPGRGAVCLMEPDPEDPDTDRARVTLDAGDDDRPGEPALRFNGERVTLG